jgi:hypothetical protein
MVVEMCVTEGSVGCVDLWYESRELVRILYVT